MIESYKKLFEVPKGFEEYKDVFKLNKLGTVLLTKSGKITNGYRDKDGYLYVTLNKNGNRKNLKIHRAVAELYIPNPKNKPCVNHKNGIKTDNRVTNLEWCTHSENMKHAVKIGLCVNSSLKGDKHNTCKHTFEEITQIRSRYKNEKISMRKLALDYNTSSGYISDVLNKKIRVEW